MIPFEPVFEHVRREPDNQIENHSSPAAGQYTDEADVTTDVWIKIESS